MGERSFASPIWKTSTIQLWCPVLALNLIKHNIVDCWETLLFSENNINVSIIKILKYGKCFYVIKRWKIWESTYYIHTPNCYNKYTFLCTCEIFWRKTSYLILHKYLNSSPFIHSFWKTILNNVHDNQIAIKNISHPCNSHRKFNTYQLHYFKS